jgi:hypothetical protein
LSLLVLKLDDKVVLPLLEFAGIVHKHNVDNADPMRLDGLQFAQINRAAVVTPGQTQRDGERRGNH